MLSGQDYWLVVAHIHPSFARVVVFDYELLLVIIVIKDDQHLTEFACKPADFQFCA